MDIVDRNGHSTDLAFLAAQGTIRIAVMGFDDRKPTEAELERMKALLAREMEDGCVGLSTGLIYPPGCYTDTADSWNSASRGPIRRASTRRTCAASRARS
jgi:N-acyl-D-amino-acid deacylase